MKVIQALRNAVGVGGKSPLSLEKHYESVWLNVISITGRGGGGGQIPGKKRYVTLECPPPPHSDQMSTDLG